MGLINIKLMDSSQKQFEPGILLIELAKAIGLKIGKSAFSARVNGKIRDLHYPLDQDATVFFFPRDSLESLELIRHSTAHILANAVQNLWPGTKVTIGPVIETGFYYDFSFPVDVKISEEDLKSVEVEMKRLIDKNTPFSRKVLSREEALQKFHILEETFKIEIIESLPETEPISVYEIGPWLDLCRGPHVLSSGDLGAFKLTSVSGSYWKGDERNPRLTRIYGTAWGSNKLLQDYLTKVEEGKKRDHRILGKQLNLFSFHKEAPANAFFHPRGAQLYQNLIEFIRKSNSKYGFQEVNTPLVMNVDLWKKSGHYENYRENMYFVKVDENEAAIKPMNCPGHCLLYSTSRHSYRQLPIRFSEFGRVHRHERSGVTHGLFRVRTFVQDDAHIFCTKEDIRSEIIRTLTQIDEAYKLLGFEK